MDAAEDVLYHHGGMYSQDTGSELMQDWNSETWLSAHAPSVDVQYHGLRDDLWSNVALFVQNDFAQAPGYDEVPFWWSTASDMPMKESSPSYTHSGADSESLASHDLPIHDESVVCNTSHIETSVLALKCAGATISSRKQDLMYVKGMWNLGKGREVSNKMSLYSDDELKYETEQWPIGKKYRCTFIHPETKTKCSKLFRRRGPAVVHFDSKYVRMHFQVDSWTKYESRHMGIKVRCPMCKGFYQIDTVQKHQNIHFKKGSQLNHRRRVVIDEMRCLAASDVVGHCAEL